MLAVVERDEGIDANDEFGPVFDGEVQTGISAQAAVYILSVADADGFVYYRQGRGGRDSKRNWRIRIPLSKDSTLSGVKIGGDDVEFFFQFGKIVGAVIGLDSFSKIPF